MFSRISFSKRFSRLSWFEEKTERTTHVSVVAYPSLFLFLWIAWHAWNDFHSYTFPCRFSIYDKENVSNFSNPWILLFLPACLFPSSHLIAHKNSHAWSSPEESSSSFQTKKNHEPTCVPHNSHSTHIEPFFQEIFYYGRRKAGRASHIFLQH